MEYNKTAWTTPQNSTESPASWEPGSTLWTPNYVMDCAARFPKMGTADWANRYYVMMAPADIAEAIGNNWGDEQALAGALYALCGKHGALTRFFYQQGPAQACALMNMYQTPTQWPTRFGSFDFRTLPPGQDPKYLAGDFMLEAPADSPTPAAWPPAEITNPFEGTGPNPNGNFVGLQTGGDWYAAMQGDTTTDGTVISEPRGKFKAVVRQTPMGTGRMYLKVA